MHGCEMMHGVRLAEIGLASQAFEQSVISIVSIAGEAYPVQLFICWHHEAAWEDYLLDNLRATMFRAAPEQWQRGAASMRVPLEHPSVHIDELFVGAS